jgi:hypothetical protein
VLFVEVEIFGFGNFGTLVPWLVVLRANRDGEVKSALETWYVVHKQFNSCYIQMQL